MYIYYQTSLKIFYILSSFFLKHVGMSSSKMHINEKTPTRDIITLRPLYDQPIYSSPYYHYGGMVSSTPGVLEMREYEQWTLIV